MSSPTPPTVDPPARAAQTRSGRPARIRARSAATLGRPEAWVAIGIVAAVLVFDAVTLWPEARLAVPPLNDGVAHFALIEQADRAISEGANALDHWNPELDLGFPQFFYYQHLGHIGVVVLDRVLLGSIDLFDLFNVVRYLLLVLFPLTVYWSTRRLGLQVAGAVCAAGAASLLSGNFRYGFEYDSYVWRGFGMFSQLVAMHLLFVAVACLYRYVQTGRGLVLAVVSFSALTLSHLMYGYMGAIAAAVLIGFSLGAGDVRERLARSAIAAGLALVVTSYMWLPFLVERKYLEVSPYFQQYKYDSFGAQRILGWLFGGDLLDHGRLPVLTALLVVGIVAALVRRSRLTLSFVALLAVGLILYFGRTTWGALADLVPFSDGPLFYRFVALVDLAAVLLIGLAGQELWRLSVRLPRDVRLGSIVLLAVLVAAPALRERGSFYAGNRNQMRLTQAAIRADPDLRRMFPIVERGGGRLYAGQRNGYGETMRVGYDPVFMLATHELIPQARSGTGAIGLNSDVLWSLNELRHADYDLVDARFVIRPNELGAAPFMRAVVRGQRMTLYAVSSSGEATFGGVTQRLAAPNQKALLAGNLAWLASSGPEAKEFIRWDFPATRPKPFVPTKPCTDGGTIVSRPADSGEADLLVFCAQPSTLVLKTTYHPNWQVTVDGRDASPYMVSPSFIAIDLPAGQHVVSAVYRSPRWKSLLLALGLVALICTVAISRLGPWRGARRPPTAGTGA